MVQKGNELFLFYYFSSRAKSILVIYELQENYVECELVGNGALDVEDTLNISIYIYIYIYIYTNIYK